MQGYTLDNVQWVHKTINFMKHDLSQDVFIQWCERVLQTQGVAY